MLVFLGILAHLEQKNFLKIFFLQPFPKQLLKIKSVTHLYWFNPIPGGKTPYGNAIFWERQRLFNYRCD